MKCPECGKEIADSSLYCEYCGAQVRRGENKTSIFWFITTLILSVIIICLCGFVYYEHMSKNEVIASEKEKLNSQLQEEIAALQEAERQVAITKQQQETETKKVSDLQSQVQNYVNEITRLNELINRKDRDISSYRDNFYDKDKEISSYKKSIADKDKEISNLRKQIPQEYKTIYDNQYLYHRVDTYSFERSNFRIVHRGTSIIIYAQGAGYGLTEFGWIPMNRLEK